eukprot:gene20542-31636_t
MEIPTGTRAHSLVEGRAYTGARILAEFLRAAGVTTAFGKPSTPSALFLADTLANAGVRLVPVPAEDHAVDACFASAALGVGMPCALVSSPLALYNLRGALRAASSKSVPILVLACSADQEEDCAHRITNGTGCASYCASSQQNGEEGGLAATLRALRAAARAPCVLSLPPAFLQSAAILGAIPPTLPPAPPSNPGGVDSVPTRNGTAAAINSVFVPCGAAAAGSAAGDSLAASAAAMAPWLPPCLLFTPHHLLAAGVRSYFPSSSSVAPGDLTRGDNLLPTLIGCSATVAQQGAPSQLPLVLVASHAYLRAHAAGQLAFAPNVSVVVPFQGEIPPAARAALSTLAAGLGKTCHFAEAAHHVLESKNGRLVSPSAAGASKGGAANNPPAVAGEAADAAVQPSETSEGLKALLATGAGHWVALGGIEGCAGLDDAAPAAAAAAASNGLEVNGHASGGNLLLSAVAGGVLGDRPAILVSIADTAASQTAFESTFLATVSVPNPTARLIPLPSAALLAAVLTRLAQSVARCPPAIICLSCTATSSPPVDTPAFDLEPHLLWTVPGGTVQGHELTKEFATTVHAARGRLLVRVSAALDAGGRAALTSLVDQLQAAVVVDIASEGSFPEGHPAWVWNVAADRAAGLAVPELFLPVLQACDCILTVSALSLTVSETRPGSTTEVRAPCPSGPSLAIAALAARLSSIGGSTPLEYPGLFPEIAAAHAALAAQIARAQPRRGLSCTAFFTQLSQHLAASSSSGSFAVVLEPGCASAFGAEHLRTSPCLFPLNQTVSGGSIAASEVLSGRLRRHVIVTGDTTFLTHAHAFSALLSGPSPPAALFVLCNEARRAMAFANVLAGKPPSKALDTPAAAPRRLAELAGGLGCAAAVAADAAALRGALAAACAAPGAPPVCVVVDVRGCADVPAHVAFSLLRAAAGKAGGDGPHGQLTRRQRLVRAQDDPSGFYAPTLRAHDTSFARRELAWRASAGAFNTWDILCHAVERWPDHPAYYQGDHTATYAAFYRRSCALAAYLRDTVKVPKGHRVAVILPNVYQCMEAHFAGAGAGACVLNLNQRLSADELGFILDDAAPVVLVAASQFAPLLIDAVRCSKKSTARGLLWVGGVPPAARAALPELFHEDFESTVSQPLAPFHRVENTAEGNCEMYYTSGTTGRPKGVILSHRAVCMHALGCMIEHRHHKKDVWGHIAPMFHLVDAYGMFSVTWVGGSHVFVPSFSAAGALAAIERHRVTVTNMASTMATLLLAHPGVEKRDFSSLQMLSCGGAPLNRETTLRAIAVFGCEVFQSYGMTESCGKIAMSLLNSAAVRSLPPSEQIDLVCTSGKRFGLPGFEMRVVKDDGTLATPLTGEVGEVQIKGPTLFVEYHNRPEDTAEAFAEGGWFKTGDLATVGAHGYITVCDRKKDMILTGGENVYSVEVERVLQDHADVKYVGVFGVPNALLGQVVKAVVELHPGSEATPNSLRRHCARLLADYKVPRDVEIVPEMPLTGTRKVAKAELKARDAAKRAARPAARPARRLDVLEDDTYSVEWKAQLIRGPPTPLCGRWVVFCGERDGLAAQLAADLKTAGVGQVDLIVPPEPGNAEFDADAIGKEAAGIVYMWALAGGPACPLGPGTTAETHFVLRGFLAVLHAAYRADAKTGTPLWVVTKGAAVSDLAGTRAAPAACSAVNAAHQALWGMARVVPAERPAVRCRIVDLCPGDEDVQASSRTLLAEITSPDGGLSQGESAYRARQRYVPRLVRRTLTPPDQ